MKKLLYIWFSLVSATSFAQIDQLTIDFYPSFMSSSKLVIEKNIDGYYIALQTSINEDKIILLDSSLNELVTFFKSYKFSHKSSIDTVGQIESIQDGDTVILYQISMGTDGLTVKGELENSQTTKTFEFWSPDKGTENYRLIEILFSLMNDYFMAIKTVDYIEQLEQYFDFGLGLKKLSDNPLTFKLYGSISSNEASELYEFFDDLPTDKRVLIDMSNFSGMGTMFDEDFLDLSESHPRLTWINCSKGAKIALKRADIARKRIK